MRKRILVVAESTLASVCVFTLLLAWFGPDAGWPRTALITTLLFLWGVFAYVIWATFPKQTTSVSSQGGE